MIQRIKQKHLLSVLEDNKYLLISFETFKQRVQNSTMRVSRDLFLENEDYELLEALENNQAFLDDKFIFVNLYTGKKLFISKVEFYYKSDYDEIFKMADIKPDKVLLQSFVRITNEE
jgi:hypothetical protein